MAFKHKTSCGPGNALGGPSKYFNEWDPVPERFSCGAIRTIPKQHSSTVRFQKGIGPKAKQVVSERTRP